VLSGAPRYPAHVTAGRFISEAIEKLEPVVGIEPTTC